MREVAASKEMVDDLSALGLRHVGAIVIVQTIAAFDCIIGAASDCFIIRLFAVEV